MRNRIELLLVLLLGTGFLLSPSAFSGEAKKKPAAKGGMFPLEIPKVSKDKVIAFALYTVHNNVLKLTAQLYPLEEGDPRTKD